MQAIASSYLHPIVALCCTLARTLDDLLLVEHLPLPRFGLLCGERGGEGGREGQGRETVRRRRDDTVQGVCAALEFKLAE